MDVIHGWDDPQVKFKRLTDGRRRGINIQFYCVGGWREAPPADYMDKIQQWCDETECGKRMSYDIIRFKNEEEYMMFMLRWQ